MIRPVALALCLASALSLAATPALAFADPLEAANRQVHAFNQVARTAVLAPIAALYTAHVPPGLRAGTARALANLGEPVSAVAALAAGETAIAANAALRFGINTTLGLGGVRDAAAARGHALQPFTLGDTACRWGVPAGPFLVLPLLGPATLRDAAAQAVSAAALAQLLGSDAVLAWGSVDTLAAYIAAHPALEQLEAESLDSYAALRSVTLQRRAAACPVDRAALEAGE